MYLKVHFQCCNPIKNCIYKYIIYRVHNKKVFNTFITTLFYYTVNKCITDGSIIWFKMFMNFRLFNIIVPAITSCIVSVWMLRNNLVPNRVKSIVLLRLSF